MVAPRFKLSWPLVKHYSSSAWAKFKRLHLGAKLFIFAVILAYILATIAIIIITPARIFQWLYDRAAEFAELRFGWMIMALLIVLVSYPPMPGHTTIASQLRGPASLVGAGIVFLSLRLFFKPRMKAWSENHEKWRALETWLPLIILIRVSPFPPWIYNNCFFASVQSVSLWQFLVATLFLFPRLFLHVFIGSRISKLADGDQRDHMDTQTKIINGLFIGGGIVVAIVAGWLIYTLTMKEVRKLEGVPQEVDELAAEAIETYDEEAPLLSSHD
ncbi:Golgi apparatus membrane protein TVP38 [Flagelloscypha sp. PMI_526]|nr:Golgi apparatus membrane protein TVP38 [Flagelloscypha sp. PMI_526]